ncbi:EamA family transporter [Herbidospora sp. NEAU-GS84]|uniref:EamA family transporter n=1 Tax=Herbidospora solisilvae TaxID=2696284 RepID=A0A7C9NR15_9ACTN|nr:EamA family transporter [Herbidospora solisilvae]NAS25136.1 EamA family transporter [Herbidospora solisilvae]
MSGARAGFGDPPLALFVVLAAVLWGTAGTAGTFAAAGAVALAAARLVIGGSALAGFVLLRAGGRVRPSPTLLLGGLCVALYQLCFFVAVNLTGVAIGTVILIGSGPVFTGLLSWALDRRAPSRQWMWGTAAAIVGCAVLLLPGGGTVDPLGVGLALVGGFIYASYAVIAARAIVAGHPSDAVMAVMFGVSALIMLPVLLTGDLSWLADPAGLATILYLGLATTALSYVLYGRGLRGTPVATASTLALAEPAVAALLGVAVLGETLSPTSWAGLAMLAVSLIVVARPEKVGSPA